MWERAVFEHPRLREAIKIMTTIIAVAREQNATGSRSLLTPNAVLFRTNGRLPVTLFNISGPSALPGFHSSKQCRLASAGQLQKIGGSFDRGT